MVAVPKDTSLKGFITFQIKFTQETWLSIYLETPATFLRSRKIIFYAYWPMLHSLTQVWILSPLHFGEEPNQQGFHALPPRVPEPPRACRRVSWAHGRAAQRVAGGCLRRAGYYGRSQLTQVSLVAKDWLRCSLLYSQLMNQDLQEHKNSQGNLTNLDSV